MKRNNRLSFVISVGLLLIFSFYEFGAAQTNIMPMGNSITWGKKLRQAPTADGTHGYRDLLYEGLGGKDVVNFVGPYPSNSQYIAEYHDPPYEGLFRDGAKIADYISGNTGYNVIQMLMEMDIDSLPKILILHIGTNDMRDNADIGNYDEAGTIAERLYILVNQLLNFTRSGHTIENLLLCKIIPFAPYDAFPSLNKRVEDYNAAIERMVEDMPSSFKDRITVVDMYSWFLPNIDEYYTSDIDGTHPNSTGYTKMADILSYYIGPILSPSERDEFTSSSGVLNGVNGWHADASIRLSGSGTIYCNSNSGSWDNLAIWENSEGGNTITIGFADNSTNFNSVAIAFGMNSTDPVTADGYMAWITGDELRIWRIVNGVASTNAIYGSTSIAMTGYGPGDSLQVTYRPQTDYNYFDVSIDGGQTKVTVRDKTSDFGKGSNLYAGIIFKVNSGVPPNPAALIDFIKVKEELPDNTAPGRIVDLSATPAGNNSVTLKWTAVGDDEYAPEGKASSYDVRIAKSPIVSDQDFRNAEVVPGAPKPFSTGTPQIFTVSGLLSGEHYYFAVKAVDELGNKSEISNMADAVTATSGVVTATFDGGMDEWEYDTNIYGVVDAGAEKEFTNITSTMNWPSSNGIAVYKGRTNPSTVEVVWGEQVTTPPMGQRENGGVALMLNGPTTNADGYLLFVHSNLHQIHLWSLVNGAASVALDTVSFTLKDNTGQYSFPEAGDTLSVVLDWSHSDYNKFEVYINGKRAGSEPLYDMNKIQSGNGTMYSGLFLTGFYNVSGRNNNVRAFITYSEITSVGEFSKAVQEPTEAEVNTTLPGELTVQLHDANRNPLRGKPVYFSVTRDQDGGEVTAPEPVFDPYRIEAEWGTPGTVPSEGSGVMELKSHPSASRGSYIEGVGDVQSCYYEYKFTVPESKRYYFWGRVVAQNLFNCIMFVELDGTPHPYFMWGALKHTSSGYSTSDTDWKWSKMQEYSSGEWFSRELDANEVHTLRIYKGHNSVKLDKIIITSNEGYVPAGMDTVRTIFTNSDGQASTEWTLGKTAGLNEVVARAYGTAQTVVFQTTGIPAAPQSIYADPAEPSSKTGVVGDTVKFTAILEDPYRNITPDIPVTWSVVRGNGTIVTPLDTTNQDGKTTVSYVIGDQDSIQQIKPTFQGYMGVDVLFQVKVTAGLVKEVTSMVQKTERHFSGQSYPNFLKVKVINDQGDPVEGTGVTFSVAEGFASVGVQPKFTNSEGIASDTLFCADTSSVVTVMASVAGIQTTVVVDSIFYKGDRLMPWGGGTKGYVDSLLATPLKVRIVDNENLPVENHPVTFKTFGNGFRFPNDSKEIVVKTDINGVARTNVRLGSVHGYYPKIVGAWADNGFNTIPDTAWFNITAKSFAAFLYYVSGDSSIGVVGEEMPDLVVKMTDINNQPVGAQPVKFAIKSGGGHFAGTLDPVVSRFTNGDGIARVTYTLGPEAGTDNNVIEVSATNGERQLTNSPIVFHLSAKSSDAFMITAYHAEDTTFTGIAGRPLEQPVRVQIVDVHGNGVAGEDVTFTVLQGGGTLDENGATTKTVTVNEASGIAEVTWIMGTDVQIDTLNNILKAEASNGLASLAGSPVKFYASLIPDSVSSSMSKITATPQVYALETDTCWITVTLTDAYGNPVSGKHVRLSVSGGSKNFMHDPVAPTDVNGKAYGYLQSLTSGEKQITAYDVEDDLHLESTATVVFLATDAEQLSPVSDKNAVRTGNVGTIYQDSLVVQVLDQNNNGVASSPVLFEISQGGGRILEDQPVVTNTEGYAWAHVILGPQPGENEVTVSARNQQGSHLENSPIIYKIEGKEGNPVHILADGEVDLEGQAGRKLNTPLTVKVLDMSGYPVYGVPIKYALVQGNGSFLTSMPVSTNEYGLAKAWFVTDTVSGNTSYIEAEAQGISLSGEPVLFTVLSKSGPARKITMIEGNNQTGYLGEQLPEALKVKITDDYGNPVSNFSVTFNVLQGDATIEGLKSVVKTTGSTGYASVKITLGDTAGVIKVEAVAPYMAGSPIVFTELCQSNRAQGIVKLEGEFSDGFLKSGDLQKGTIGRLFVDPLRVKVIDEYGNPVPNKTVRFNKESGPGEISGTNYVRSDDNGIASIFVKAGATTGQTVISAFLGNTVTFNLETVYNSSYPTLNRDDMQSDYYPQEDEEFIIGLVANPDPDGDGLTFQMGNLFPPSGSRVEKQTDMTAVFRWTPTYEQEGDYEIILRVRDGKGGCDADTISLHVTKANRFPSIISTVPTTKDTSVIGGQTITFMVNASDPDNDQLHYTWSVDGNSVGSDSPILEYMFPYNFTGQQTVSVIVSDDVGYSNDGKFQWNVSVKVAVQFADFGAAFDLASRRIRIFWETVYEQGNKGFYVYRSKTENGEYSPVTDELIPSNEDRLYEFFDRDIVVGQTYYYKIIDVGSNNAQRQFGPVKVTVPLPTNFVLGQNYPNPFNPGTKIFYQIADAGRVSLSIYNMMGQRVATLVDRHQTPGYYTVEWNGLGSDGNEVSTGIYIYRLECAGKVLTKRMVKMK